MTDLPELIERAAADLEAGAARIRADAAIIAELREALTDARLFVALVEVHWPVWHDDAEQGAEATDCLAKIDTALRVSAQQTEGVKP